MKLLIIGAGPAGLAAARGAVARGFDVTVLERYSVGAGIRSWGVERFFSPLAMNVPPSFAVSDGDAILTGHQFVDAVLAPIAKSLDGRVLENHRVVAVGRDRLSRGDLPGHPVRAERGFRVLVETPAGERTFEADAVLDASGVPLHVPFGAGGVPAPGEREREAFAIRSLGQLAAQHDALAGSHIAIIGHGHSAASALVKLPAFHVPQVTWVVRTPNLRPCVEVASDPLPERARVVSRANELAAKPPPWLRVERRAHVVGVGPRRLELTGGRVVECDRVVALVGRRPDLSFVSELALDISPATEGSGGIARALANITDCLAVPSLSRADLASGEPGFHFIGAKSYGRARTFLLRNGYAQIDAILDGLA